MSQSWKVKECKSKIVIIKMFVIQGFKILYIVVHLLFMYTIAKKSKKARKCVEGAGSCWIKERKYVELIINTKVVFFFGLWLCGQKSQLSSLYEILVHRWDSCSSFNIHASFLCSPRLCLFDQKCSKYSQIITMQKPLSALWNSYKICVFIRLCVDSVISL